MNQARKNREEKNKNVVNQLQDFANDSIVFFNKCAKPDKNGRFKLGVITVCRVYEDSLSMRHGFPRHRIHWIYHKAGVHTYQQHHPWCLRLTAEQFISFIYILFA